MRIAHSGRGRRSVRPQPLARRKAAPGHRGTGKTKAVHAVKEQGALAVQQKPVEAARSKSNYAVGK
jgi:hypothetical protein